MMPGAGGGAGLLYRRHDQLEEFDLM